MSTTARTATCATPEVRLRSLVAAALLLLCACEGDQGPAGPAGPGGGGGGGTDPDEPTPTAYSAGADVPELVVRIEGLSGASGPGGEFLPGDVLTLEFSLEKADGEPWELEELVAGEALVSGPSFNYQRVLPLETDVLARASKVAAGLYRYAFAAPLPTSYAAPYNDTPSFGPNSGDLGGRDLLDGTYTLGLSLVWDYTVEGRPFRRVGEATLDFLVGTGAGPLTPRGVTSEANCARCHGELRAHDGRYRKLELCLLCHTSGAEDLNDPAIAGGTPGVTIDSRVLFHKLHAGRYLPSVNGVATRGNGNRNYDAPPVPLQYVRADGTVLDFSHVGFPVLANRDAPMPRDTGYANLSASQQAQEDRVRSAPTRCAVCHGDPDGAGPLEPPPQAALIHISSRRACGACHDDVNFASSYRSNGQSMPPQSNDNGCNNCHDTRFPSDLSPIDAHVHPLDRPDFDPGLRLAFTALEEAGAADGDGTLDPGEKLALEFTLTDDEGDPLAPSALQELAFVLAGPNSNHQVLHATSIPTGLVTGPPPHRLLVPERITLEHLGDSGPGLDVFQSERFPHRLASGVTTEILVRTATTGGASTLVAARARHDTQLDVVDASGFAAGDVIVVADGVAGEEEYLRIAFVGGRRLHLVAPTKTAPATGLRHAHAAGTSVREVVLEAVAPSEVLLDPLDGTISELVELGAGRAVLASYTSDYVVPDEYPQALNGSPDLNDRRGKWSGHALVSGTYAASLSAVRALDFRLGTTITSYRSSSPGATREVLVGDAAAPTPYTRIADGASCDACHVELVYHEGTYRGFDTCILCHGASGSEDLPRSVAANAPETRARSVEFRTLLHKVHRGQELADASYQVIGTAAGSGPDAFRAHAYHGYSTLPAHPGRTLECARCHGEGNEDALLPEAREHPSQQENPLQTWRPACATCHDDAPTQAHVDSNTALTGAEACDICHLPGEFADAQRAHAAALEPR